jgi:hypothetical protein
MTEATEPQAATARKTAIVSLDTPIKREGGDVTSLTIRKPQGGELRGLRLPDLLNGDTTALITVLPRITTPFISEQEAASLEADDLVSIADEVIGFLLTAKKREMIRQANGG